MAKYIQINRVDNGFIFGIQPEEDYRGQEQEPIVRVYPADRDGVEEMLDEIQFRLDISDQVTEYVPRENADNSPVTRQLVTGYFTADELMEIVTNMRYNERDGCCEEPEVAFHTAFAEREI